MASPPPTQPSLSNTSNSTSTDTTTASDHTAMSAPATAAAAAAILASTASSTLGAAATRTAHASLSTRPLSGLFALNKPSGPTSMSLLDALKPLFASSPLFAPPDSLAPPPSHQRANRSQRGTRRSKWRGRGGGPAGAPKLGQGGTLDPLADGVLVLGVGTGTKHLQRYLDCTKEYRTTALLGAATTSYDACDPVLLRAPSHHVTPALLARLLPRFTGSLLQIPPLYSAVRIDGKRLFEYAREGKELPRPIEPRRVRVEELRLVQWLPAGMHAFTEPDREVPDDEKALVGRVRKMAGRDEGMTDTSREDGTPDGSAPVPAAQPDDPGDEAQPATVPSAAAAEDKGVATQPDPATAASPPPPPPSSSATTPPPPTLANLSDPASTPAPAAFTLEMTVSSGTYVRSIVHDLALAAHSAAHVQRLTRTRQGEWSIDTPPLAFHGPALPNEPSASASAPEDEAAKTIKGNCLPWRLFAEAIEEMQREEREDGYRTPRDEQGLREWERELLRVFVPV